MIAVVTYGVSNIGSIFSMLRKIGVAAEAAETAADIERAEKIILPGVGSFDHGVTTLTEKGLMEPLRARAAAGVPFLGICLGMQLLGDGSDEGGKSGLGLIPGRCAKFQSAGPVPVKVPHMGWNVVTERQANPLLTGMDARARFYFVHSYHLVCACPDDVLATTQYGVEFTSMVHHANVWGAQFHPEKSHRYGMALLRNFSSL